MQCEFSVKRIKVATRRVLKNNHRRLQLGAFGEDYHAQQM